MNKTLLVAGVGRLNSRVADAWLKLGGTVVGFRRNVPEGALPFAQHSLDLSQDSWPDVGADYVVVALSAGERSETAYRRTYVESLAQLKRSLSSWTTLPERILVVSSSRVYGADDGRLIDDALAAETDDVYGQILLDMEATLHSIDTKTSALRLSGLYGPGRDWLKRQALGATDATFTANKWTNRIHIDDAAAAVIHLLQSPSLASHYIVSDTQPQTQFTMYNYFREKAGVEKLRSELPATTGKRLIPTGLQQSGFQWRYPDAFSGGYE